MRAFTDEEREEVEDFKGFVRNATLVEAAQVEKEVVQAVEKWWDIFQGPDWEDKARKLRDLLDFVEMAALYHDEGARFIPSYYREMGTWVRGHWVTRKK